MSRVPVVIWTLLRVAAAVLLAGWAALHLRLLDGVIGLGLPEWFKPPGMALLLVGGVVVLLCGGMLSNGRECGVRTVGALRGSADAALGSITWRTTTKPVPHPWNSPRFRIVFSCDAHEVPSHASVQQRDAA
jgi:hypothetical protein